MLKEAIKYLYDTLEAQNEGVKAKLWRGEASRPFYAIRYTLEVNSRYSELGTDNETDLSISAHLDQFNGDLPEADDIVEIVGDKKYQIKSLKIKTSSIILNLGKEYA